MGRDECAACAWLPVVRAPAFENSRDGFLNPCLPGSGLFGTGKVAGISSLPPRRQGMESGGEIGVFVQLAQKFVGEGKVCARFELHLQTGFFYCDGLVNAGFQGGVHSGDLCSAGEADLAGGLDVFGLPDQDVGGVGEQGTFEEQQRAVVFESVDQDDIVGASGTHDFLAPMSIRSDEFFFRGTRLPYAKFPRDPTL